MQKEVRLFLNLPPCVHHGTRTHPTYTCIYWTSTHTQIPTTKSRSSWRVSQKGQSCLWTLALLTISYFQGEGGRAENWRAVTKSICLLLYLSICWYNSFFFFFEASWHTGDYIFKPHNFMQFTTLSSPAPVPKALQWVILSSAAVQLWVPAPVTTCFLWLCTRSHALAPNIKVAHCSLDFFFVLLSMLDPSKL